MVACKDAGARTGTRWPGPKLLHAFVLRGVIKPATEGGAEVRIVASAIGDEVVAPIIEYASVGIGEIVRGVGLESCGAGLEAVDGGVIVPNRPTGCFDLSTMEHTVAEIHRAARIQAKSVGGVMGVRRGHPHQDAFDLIGFAVAITVSNEPKVGSFHDEHSVFVKLKPRWGVEVV